MCDVFGVFGFRIVAQALFASLNLAIPFALKPGNGGIELRRAEEMQVHQPLPQLGHLLEKLIIGGERDPGKVNAKELSIILPVGGSIGHSISSGEGSSP